ncbi:MAG: T9SS type A sorting domain-containing protein [Flavobacteriales bacterium]|nr:T9SS type A sorting domain-containing protein [Flavobacteriales bacterium]
MIKLVPLILAISFSYSAHCQYFNGRYDFFQEPDLGTSIVVDHDQYVAAGWGYDSLGRNSIGLIRLDASGLEIEKKHYSPPEFHSYYPGNVGAFIHNNNGGYNMTGSVWDSTGNTNVYMFWFNSLLDTTNYIEIDLGKDELAYQCKQTPDNGFIITGKSEDGNNIDILLLKLDSSGGYEWHKTYGGPETELGIRVSTAFDGGYIIGGYTKSFGNGDFDTYIIKTDSLGNIEWDMTYGDQNFDPTAKIIQLSDSNYIISSSIKKYDIGSYEQRKLRLIKIDTVGSVIWDKEYGTPRYGTGSGDAIELENGDLIVIAQTTDTTGSSPAGNGFPEGVILKVSSEGDSIWWRKIEYSETIDAHNYPRAIKQTNDGGFVGAGFILPGTGDGGTQDMWVFKLDSEGYNTGFEPIAQQGKLMSIYPNPASGTFTVSIDNIEPNQMITLYNHLGGRINEFPVITERTAIDVSNLANGVYLVQVTQNNLVVGHQKVVLRN